MRIAPYFPCRAGRIRTLGLASWTCLAALGLVGALAPAGVSAQEQTAQASVPDQVFVLRRSSNEVVSFSGVLTRNDMSGVELQEGSKTSEWDASDVRRVVLGDLPPSYRDGQTLFARGDWENAAARFKIAATDAAARPIVQASARLLAGQSLLRWGALDPVHFGEARSEFDTFLAEHPENREVPLAQRLRARAAWLSGDPAAAGAGYREVFEKLSGTSAAPGYDALECVAAGVQAGRALLAAEDTLAAREVFTQVDSAASALISELEAAPNPAQAGALATLQNLRGVARVGQDGFAELVGGNLQSAKNYFADKVQNVGPTTPPAERFAALLGLARAELAEGKLRDAEFRFAQVAALDYTDRDRVAEALVGQAECAQKIGGPDAAAESKALLALVLEQYGETPAALLARERLPDE